MNLLRILLFASRGLSSFGCVTRGYSERSLVLTCCVWVLVESCVLYFIRA